MRPEDKWNAGSCDELRVNLRLSGSKLKKSLTHRTSPPILSSARKDKFISLDLMHLGKVLVKIE